ncbi:MAG: hypothetical protein KIT72_06265 [Polyangiaceae bacterium]|nr:hypothetical protein [Polyangiaceae bacterium]MCW5790005.1 hypothetical protein [Polyangiaceae bacterium]
MSSSALSGWTVVRVEPSGAPGFAIVSLGVDPYHSEHALGCQAMVLTVGRAYAGVLFYGGVLAERRYFGELTSAHAWFEQRLASRRWKQPLTKRRKRPGVLRPVEASLAASLAWAREVDAPGFTHFSILSTARELLDDPSHGAYRAAEVERALSSNDCFIATSFLFPVSVDVSCYGDRDQFVIQTVSGEWEDFEPPSVAHTLSDALRECDERMMRAHRLVSTVLPELVLDEGLG